VSIALSLAGAVMFAGTLDLLGIVHAQVTQHIWFILAQPLGFLLYGIAAVAEVNRAPFDLPEAEQELVAGYLTEFSGLRWSLFQMAEYVNMVTVSSLAVTLYFGGWTLGALDGVPGVPFIWYVIKVAACLFVFIWLRATLPRIRYDKLMRFGWQTLLPLSVLNLVATSIIVTLAPPNYQWLISLGFSLVVLGIFALIYMRRSRRAGARQHVMEVGMAMPGSVRLVHGYEVAAATVGTAASGAGGASSSGGAPPDVPAGAEGAARR
jgi:NADH-quinone oxidoreductase subunit H